MSTPAAPKPPIGPAIAIALAVFVGVTSIFDAVMAAGVAPLQLRETGISGTVRNPDNAARWLCYALAAAFLVNGTFVLRSGRSDVRIAAVCTALFVLGNIALAILYVKTW